MSLGRRLTPTGNKPADPPVKPATLNELFGDQLEGAKARGEYRAKSRASSPGKPPARQWVYGSLRVAAHTRSEARALIKRRLNLARLQPGTRPLEITEAP